MIKIPWDKLNKVKDFAFVTRSDVRNITDMRRIHNTWIVIPKRDKIGRMISSKLIRLSSNFNLIDADMCWKGYKKTATRVNYKLYVLDHDLEKEQWLSKLSSFVQQ